MNLSKLDIHLLYQASLKDVERLKTFLAKEARLKGELKSEIDHLNHELKEKDRIIKNLEHTIVQGKLTSELLIKEVKQEDAYKQLLTQMNKYKQLFEEARDSRNRLLSKLHSKEPII